MKDKKTHSEEQKKLDLPESEEDRKRRELYNLVLNNPKLNAYQKKKNYYKNKKYKP